MPHISKWVDEWSVDDYPYGRFRTKASWYVVKKGNKETVGRVTVDPKNGRTNTPKLLTYGSKAKIGIGSDDRVYILVGAAGQIGTYGGDLSSLGSVFTDDPQYAEFAKALGIKSGGKAEVSLEENGATIDGLQGKVTTPREIFTLGGLTEADFADIASFKKKDTVTHTLWTIVFKDRQRKKYEIKVRV